VEEQFIDQVIPERLQTVITSDDLDAPGDLLRYVNGVDLRDHLGYGEGKRAVAGSELEERRVTVQERLDVADLLADFLRGLFR